VLPVFLDCLFHIQGTHDGDLWRLLFQASSIGKML
jgi:hypothetical protein